MTRETKIGLLVGLAFLLVVGILLSEHITGATDRPAAPLADAGTGVTRGVAAPGAGDEPTVKLAEKPAGPQTPVPSPADLTPKPPVTHVTVVTPQQPNGQTPTVIVTESPAAQPQPTGPTVVTPAPNTAPAPGGIVTVRAPTDPFANDPVAKVAREMGQTVVPISNGTKPTVTTTTVTTVATTGTTSAREYKAQAGDTLSRLASQVPGGNVKANRDAVVALNPILQKDPNRVLSGRTYLLPTQAAARTVQPAVVTNTTKAPVAKAVVLIADTRTYVVKPGDTLSKIASTELGSKSELPALRALNADVLKGSDVIKVNMKLKLPPAKASMASASIR